MSASNPMEGVSLVERFNSINWSFDGRKRTREFHPYPARFINEIPRHVFELTQPTGPILDPFCGSGTTLFEARRVGLDAIGNDVNPIACLISRVRSAKPPEADLVLTETHAIEVWAAAKYSQSVDARFQAIPRIDHWFTEGAQRAMAGAVSYLDSLNVGPAVLDLLSVGISAATVRISNQDSDTRYAAIDKGRTQDEAADFLKQSIERVVAIVRESSALLTADARVEVRQGNAQRLEWIPDESVGMACFSPPYPNAYEYWLYHKYRMYWLGFDPVEIRGQEIGARPHYSKPNGLTEADFLAQMHETYSELMRVLRPGSFAVAVVGDSFIGGRHVDNGDLLSAAAESVNMSIEVRIQRQVAEGRSSFNRAHSRGRKYEHIIVARKRD